MSSKESKSSKGGDEEVADVPEIPLENEASHERLDEPSCFITDEDTLKVSGSAKSASGKVATSDHHQEENATDDDHEAEDMGSSNDNTDGNAFSSCFSSFSTKDEEHQASSSDPDGISDLAKTMDGLSVTASSTDGDHVGTDGKAEKDDSDTDMSPLWRSQRYHIFILSEAGKPIYSRHGNEEKMVAFFGLLQALVSFLQSDGDTIRAVKLGDTNIVFLVKSPLILVCVSQKAESIPQLETHLIYFYNQIISILTSRQLQRIFEKRKNYDLRRLLSGSERLLNNLAGLIEIDPSFVLGAVRCLPLANTVRDSISQTITTILNKTKPPPPVVFALLVANTQLVSIVRMKKVFMHPMDLHVIFNLIDASESFKTVDSWVPICLPRFDSSGFMYAHVSYLADDCQACLILLTTDRNSFFPLSEAKQKIVERLRKQNCLDAINASMNNPWPTMSFISVPEIRHFLYKAKYRAQLVAPVLDAPYINPNIGSQPETEDLNTSQFDEFSRANPPYATKKISEEIRRLYSSYFKMHSRLHSQARSVKIMYWVDDKENWLGWNTSAFELYVALEPLVKKSAAISAVNKLLKWIKKEEDRIFIMNAPTF